MLKLKNLYLLSSAVLACIACSENGTVVTCDYTAVINKDKFDQNTPTAFSGISNVTLQDDCLRLTLTDSGCDGSTWDIAFVDSGDIAESLPVQRFVKIFVTNEELCTAIINREISIDISPLKVENESSLNLNIENYAEQILYEF